MDTMGLGVRLEIIDNTLQATNRILSNMERLQNAAQRTAGAFNDLGNTALHMNSLMEAGFALQFAGDTVTKAGTAILGTLGRIGAGVVKTGAQFETFRQTLTALYKDPVIVNQKLDWAMDYAASTPFEITDLVKNMIGFKAIKVDVDTMMKDMNGTMRPFMSYIGDLAALRPDQGLSGILVAVRELMSGQTMSFKRRLEVDPEMILGREINTSSVEAAMKDVAELSQKLAGGLMDKLMGTWNVMLTNMKEQGVRVMLAIADSGAFDAAKRTLASLFNFLTAIDDDRIALIGKNLAGVFTLLWTPIDWAAKLLLKVAAAFEELSAHHPLLAKLIFSFVAFGGIALTTVGVLFKLTGGLMLTGAAITQLIVNMGALTGKTMQMEAAFMRVVRFTKVFLSVFAIGSLIFAGAMLAYQKNLFGFRDTVDNVVSKFTDRWRNVTQALKDGDVGKIMKFDKAEAFLAKVILIGDTIKTLFTGDDGQGHVIFSEKQYKLLQSMGLWDTAVKLVMLKARVEAFFRGFGQGVSNVLKAGEWLVSRVFKPIGDFIYDSLPVVGNLVDRFLELFGIEPGKTGDIAYWEKLGVIIGTLATAVLGIKALGRLADWIASPFVKILKNMLGIKQAVKDTKGMVDNMSTGDKSKKKGGMYGGCCCCCDDMDGKRKGTGGGSTVVAGGGLDIDGKNKGGDADDGLGPRSAKHGKRQKGLMGLINRLMGKDGMVFDVADNADDVAKGAAKVGKFTKFLKSIPVLGTALGLASGGATMWAAAQDGGWQQAIGQNAGSTAGGVTGGIVGGAIGTMLLPGVGTAVGAVGGALLGDWLGGLMDKAGWTQAVVDGAVHLWEGIRGAWNDGVKWIGDAGRNIGDWFGNLIDWGVRIKDNLPYYIGYATGRAIKFFEDLGKDIWAWGGRTLNNLWEWAKSVPGKIKEAWVEGIPNLISNFAELYVRWTIWKENFKTKAKEWALGVVDDIVAYFKALPDRIGEALGDAKDWVVGGTINNFKDIGRGIEDFFSGAKDGYSGNAPKYANGGILTNPHYGLVAEDGPEAIIPLDPKKRGRGLQLLQMAAEQMGVAHADGGIFGKKAAPVQGGGNMTINNLHINIQSPAGATGKPEDARSHAKMVARELKKLLREGKLRAGSNFSLEDLILDA